MKNLYRTSILFVVLLALAIGMITCGEKEKVIKIGAILPLTGDAAQAGVNTKLGIDLAIEEINKAGGINGHIVEVVYEDCQGQPKLAVSAMQKLTDIDKVAAVIDNSLSNVTLAIAPIAESKKVILLATGASSPKISHAGDYVFRIWNSDDLEGDVMAQYAIGNLKIKQTAILYINNDYGLGLQQVFKENFERLGGDIVAKEMFQAGEKDFKNQITKILQNSFTAIYLVGYPTECSGTIKQLKRLGYNGMILGTIVMADPIVQKAIQRTGYICYYPVPKQPDIQNPAVAKFIEAFKKKYEKEPPMLADVGYDAARLIFMGMSSGQDNYDGKTIKNYFYKMSKYDGASGSIKFDSNGDVRKPIIVVR